MLSAHQSETFPSPSPAADAPETPHRAPEPVLEPRRSAREDLRDAPSHAFARSGWARCSHLPRGKAHRTRGGSRLAQGLAYARSARLRGRLNAVYGQMSSNTGPTLAQVAYFNEVKAEFEGVYGEIRAYLTQSAPQLSEQLKANNLPALLIGDL